MTGEIAWIHLVTRIVEIVGTAIIVVGSFGSLALFLFRMATNAAPRDTLVAAFRSNLGRSILLGLNSSSQPTSSIPSRSNRPSKACSCSPVSS